MTDDRTERAGRDDAGGSGAGASLRTETLARVPQLSALYRTALARSARLMLTRGGPGTGGSRGTDALPSVAYEARGATADIDGLAAYQRVVGEPGSDALPAGYVHVLAFPLAMALMVRPDFPLPVLGMVHIANRVTQHRPVLLGEPLDLRAEARDPRRHRRGTQLELAVSARAGDELVWEGVSTYLAPGRHLAGLPDAAPRGRRAHAAGAVTALWRLSPQVAADYAEVSGDRNPIHTSRVGARLLGFPRRIAHGMYTAARALAEVGPRRGAAFTWRVDFAKPVLLPSTVAVRIEPPSVGIAPVAGTGERRSGQGGAGAGAPGFTFLGSRRRDDAVHFSGIITPHTA